MCILWHLSMFMCKALISKIAVFPGQEGLHAFMIVAVSEQNNSQITHIISLKSIVVYNTWIEKCDYWKNAHSDGHFSSSIIVADCDLVRRTLSLRLHGKFRNDLGVNGRCDDGHFCARSFRWDKLTVLLAADLTGQETREQFKSRNGNWRRRTVRSPRGTTEVNTIIAGEDRQPRIL